VKVPVGLQHRCTESAYGAKYDRPSTARMATEMVDIQQTTYATLL
jgi:hypothetical protein